MKIKLFTTLAAVIALTLAVACSTQKDHDHEHGDEHAEAAKDSTADADWKEMDNFHMIMAETFHPYKDSANLAPVKGHASHMAMEASQWAAAPLPEKVNNDEMKKKLEALKNDTQTLADKVKAGASDDDIAKTLTNVHDQFHKIQEGWYGGGEHEHH